MPKQIVSSKDQEAARKKDQTQSRGVGDTIAKATSAVGIKPCGRCKKSQKWLNDRFPYKPRGK
mgnify:CR=1 FL=1